MARIRSVKPTFFRSRSVKALTSDEKLVWIGLWTLADDAGRLLDEPEILAGDLWALSLNASKIDKALTSLHTKGRVVRYESAGHGFIQVTGWAHQKISHPTPSEIPSVMLPNDSGNVRESFPPDRRGKEGIGGGEPPRFCGKHPSGTSDPCGPCRDARMGWEAWKTKDDKPQPTPGPPRKEDLCPVHEWNLRTKCTEHHEPEDDPR